MRQIASFLIAGAAFFNVIGGEMQDFSRAKAEHEAALTRHQQLREENHKLKKQIQVLNESARIVRADAAAVPPGVENSPAAPRVIYQGTPESSGDAAIKPGIEFVRLADGNAVRATATGGSGSVIFTRVIAVPEGSRLRCSMEMKGEQIGKKEKTHVTGSRFCATFDLAGKRYWKGVRPANGTFDWDRSSFEFDVPLGVTRVMICAGLSEQTTGSLLMRNLRVETIR
ncbi:MAG: hypothetical protein PHS41_05780 [Victivallaceae bacterium]|nr:hypothetical protein [Victivallaceae bacterium]